MARKKTLVEDASLTPEQLKTLVRVMKDPFFFSTFCYVINPVLGMVKFLLYPFQKAVLYQFMLNRFNIILKFRQAGITELISLYCLWLAMYHPNKKINIISIKDTVAKKVLKKIKFMYKNLPSYLQEPIINGRAGEFGSVSTIEFANGSVIESIPTSDQAGRSESLSLLVIDEAAIVRWASTIWASSFPTLSTGGAAIVNSCITGDTQIIGKDGPFRVDSICPKTFGKMDISHLGLRVLSHTGKWQRVLGSVNKGVLKTWEVHNEQGRVIKCTPKHKLYTLEGWLPVSEIIKRDIPAIFYHTGISGLEQNPVTVKPKKEICKPIPGYPNYEVSNWGRIFIVKNGTRVEKLPRPCNNRERYLNIRLWNKGQKKKICVHNLVAKVFLGEIPEGYVVDHINNNPSDNYVTNLQIVTVAENSQKAAKYSYGMKLGYKLKGGFNYDLRVVAYIRYRYQELGYYYGVLDKISKEVEYKFGIKLNKPYIQRIVSGKRCTSIYLSKLKVVRKYYDTIYDICVEHDESYLINEDYVSHNTPYGVGNFFHSTWVDAISGGNPFNPIRLYWQMHPDRDEKWYAEMSAALGPKRTAQEIDGDFLSSGNTVFDLADIKAIEECLFDYQIINTRLKGQYKEFNEPDPNKEYFIGGDCATGRGTDYSAFTCMDRDGEEAAVYKGRIPLNKYARLLGDIGEKYNFAKLAPETNDVGMTVTTILQDEGYPNLYFYTKLLRKKRKNRPEEDKFPGWLTTTKNRSVIIENLEKDIREENVIVKDPFFVQEAYTFIYDGAGRPIARGKHRMNNSSMDLDLEGETYSDDAIFGKAITNHIRCHSASNTVVIPQ
jgi:hypothetical protein